MATVRVTVPATTGNVGSGFDCLGMALELYNTIEITDDTDGFEVVAEGEGADLVPTDGSNLCVRAAKAVFDKAEIHPSGLRFCLHHTIPVSRGLGSSGAAIVGGAVGANELAGRPLTVSDILRICTDLEGHPDNVAPSLLGGFAMSGERDGKILYRAYPVDRHLKAVVAVPDFTLNTAVAREALPDRVSMRDAVYNLCSASFLIAGMLKGDYELLRPGLDDRLHQPYRSPLVPGLGDVISAARDAGAHGAALSGAGPTVIAFATQHHSAIGLAMQEAFTRHDISSRVMTLHIDNEGARTEVID